MNDDNQLWQLVEEEAVQAEQSAVRAQFGKMSVDVSRYIHWVDGQPIEVDSAAFATLGKRERSIELLLSVDIQEFRPELEWTYERKVRIGDNDWWKIFKPSVEAIKGEHSMSQGTYAGTLQSLDGAYVEAHDVPQIKSPDYNTFKLMQVFPDRNACFKAWEEKYGGDGGAIAQAGVPEGWSAEAWSNVVPAIKDALAIGDTPSQVADAYGVPVQYVATLK